MKIFIVSILLILTAGAFADSDEKTTTEVSTTSNPYKLSFGVQGGLNIANATLDPVSNSTSRVGFNLGIFAQAPLMPGFLYIQPELNFIQKGAQNTHFGGLTYANLSYLEFPILAKIKFTLPHVKPFVLAGPSLGYLLSAGSDGAVPLTRNNFSAFDISIAIGGGVGFSLGDSVDSPEAFFAVRYSYALNNIDTSATASWHSDGFQLALGAQF